MQEDVRGAAAAVVEGFGGRKGLVAERDEELGQPVDLHDASLSAQARQRNPQRLDPAPKDHRVPVPCATRAK